MSRSLAGKETLKKGSNGQSFPRSGTWLVGIRTIGIGIALAVLDAFENFFAVNSHGLWRIDSNADLVSFHSENRNGYVLANDY
jgi:hypothetical protein